MARPMTSGSTPVAKGSSVPVWPTFGEPIARRTTATTSCEVGPAGLSMTRTPFMITRARTKLFTAEGAENAELSGFLSAASANSAV